jgi:transposase
MGRVRRRFSREFKVQVLREIEAGKQLAQAGREHEVHPNQIRKWQDEHRVYAEKAFSGNGSAYTEEARIAELERTLGQMTMENALLKKALTRLEARPAAASPVRGSGTP